MNVIRVAADLHQFIEGKDWDGANPHSTWVHLRWMLTGIMNKSVAGEKAHRWIGYVQGVLVAYNAASLEEMKRINAEGKLG